LATASTTVGDVSDCVGDDDGDGVGADIGDGDGRDVGYGVNRSVGRSIGDGVGRWGPLWCWGWGVNLDRNCVHLDLCENDEETGSKMHANWGSLVAPW
jgi:hypothetical protein